MRARVKHESRQRELRVQLEQMGASAADAAKAEICMRFVDLYPRTDLARTISDGLRELLSPHLKSATDIAQRIESLHYTIAQKLGETSVQYEQLLKGAADEGE